MADIAFVSGSASETSGAGIGSGTRTHTINNVTLTTGQCVVAFGLISNAGTTVSNFSVTDTKNGGGSNTYTKVFPSSGVSDNTVINASIGNEAAWVCQNCSAMTNGSITLTWIGSDNGNGWALRLSFAIFDNVDAASAFVSSFSKSGNGSSMTSNAFSIAPQNSVVVVNMASSGVSTFSAGNVGGASATMPSGLIYPANPSAVIGTEYKIFSSSQTDITAAMNGGNFDQLAMIGIILQGTVGPTIYPISARMGMGKEGITNSGFGSPVIIGF